MYRHRCVEAWSIVIPWYGYSLSELIGCGEPLSSARRLQFYTLLSAKSIVRLHFTDRQPHTNWNDINSHEYGFYSNVNPKVDHQRWTQDRERLIESGILSRYIPTQILNGYAGQVAGLYNGMDLKRFY